MAIHRTLAVIGLALCLTACQANGPARGLPRLGFQLDASLEGVALDGRITIDVRGMLAVRRLMATTADVERVAIQVVQGGTTVAEATITRVQLAAGTTSHTFTGLAAGEYGVRAQAFDAAGGIIGRVSDLVTVKSGELKALTMRMTLAGTLVMAAPPPPAPPPAPGSLAATLAIGDGLPFEATGLAPTTTVTHVRRTRATYAWPRMAADGSLYLPVNQGDDLFELGLEHRDVDGDLVGMLALPGIRSFDFGAAGTVWGLAPAGPGATEMAIFVDDREVARRALADAATVVIADPRGGAWTANLVNGLGFEPTLVRYDAAGNRQGTLGLATFDMPPANQNQPGRYVWGVEARADGGFEVRHVTLDAAHAYHEGMAHLDAQGALVEELGPPPEALVGLPIGGDRLFALNEELWRERPDGSKAWSLVAIPEMASFAPTLTFHAVDEAHGMAWFQVDDGFEFHTYRMAI